MNTSTSSIPRELPTVVTFRYQNQKKPVTLAASHQEAQEIAARTFPSLANVDPSWLQFSTAVRYRATGERREFDIPPEDWYYVTSKLVAYRCIDVHVVPPRPSLFGTPSSQASSLHLVTPPQDDMSLYPEEPRTSFYRPLPPSRDDLSVRYPTPPPQYPGSVARAPPTTGFGYGFSWGPAQQNVRPSPLYGSFSPPYGMVDHKRSPSKGWSLNSVAPAAPFPRSVSEPVRPPSPTFASPSPPSRGLGLFSSIRQRVLPAPWTEPRGRMSRRRRRNSQPTRVVDSEDEEYYSQVTTRSGRSYVPSLI